MQRLVFAACIALFLVGCSSSANVDEPYVVQVDCAQVFEDQTYQTELKPNEQLVTLWYSDGTFKQEVRPGQCFQDAKRYYVPKP
jgi:hypothetical protein